MAICKTCVLPDTYEGIEFDENGVCNYCRDAEKANNHEDSRDFFSEEELAARLAQYRDPRNKYDVLVPLSGGVDSCNALLTIVETFGLRALAFHNDQGYEDPQATENAREICRALDVDLIVAQQEFGFMRKLYKYINESRITGLNSCYVCGNILYINAIEVADHYGVPLIINGYSKGQSRQINDQNSGIGHLDKMVAMIEATGDSEFANAFMKKFEILDKRIPYRSKQDLQKPPDPGKILFIPFYIFDFYKLDKSALRERIVSRCDWRPMTNSYPRRTTNCFMIWLNSYMDLKKMGYTCYHSEYAEHVRQGEISREQALDDLRFEPPEGLVEKLAREVNMDLSLLENVERPPESEEQAGGVVIDFDF